MYKFYLIYNYHYDDDDFIKEFDNWNECLKFIEFLKVNYKFCSCFRYKVIKGLVVSYSGIQF